MSSYDTQNISVLNYNQNEVFVSSGKEDYKFGASKDGIIPTIASIPLNELQSISSNTEIIRTGWLRFEDDIQEKVYKDLRITNWKDILTNEEIKDILIHPTLEGLQKIVDIDNQTYFDRVRIAMFLIMRDGVDVTTKVSRIVEQRYNELRNRKRISSIVLTPKDTKQYATPNDVKELAEQNSSLQAQLEEMKQMMAEMMKAQLKTSTNVENDVKTEESSTAKKKPGRPTTKQVS